MTSFKALTRGLLVCSVLMAGCGTEDPTEVEQDFSPSADMVGTWIFQSVTVNGSPAQLSDVLEWLPATVEARLHVLANGAYVYEEVNSSGGQLWAESGFVLVNFEIDEFELNVQADTDGPASGVIPSRSRLWGACSRSSRWTAGIPSSSP